MAPRGDVYDRVAALERQVETLLQRVASLQSQRPALAMNRWPAMGTVPEGEGDDEGGIEEDEIGEVDLVNQFSESGMGTVKAKNKTGKKIPAGAICVIHLINGTLVITSAISSDCRSLSKPLEELGGYDAAKKQALIHLPESEEGEDDGCMSWMTIEECPPPEEP